jgi:hypothetical protein
MAGAVFYTYPGYGERARKEYGYSQAVRMGNRVEVCGQGTSRYSHIVILGTILNKFRRLGSQFRG